MKRVKCHINTQFVIFHRQRSTETRNEKLWVPVFRFSIFSSFSVQTIVITGMHTDLAGTKQAVSCVYWTACDMPVDGTQRRMIIIVFDRIGCGRPMTPSFTANSAARWRQCTGNGGRRRAPAATVPFPAVSAKNSPVVHCIDCPVVFMDVGVTRW